MLKGIIESLHVFKRSEHVNCASIEMRVSFKSFKTLEGVVQRRIGRRDHKRRCGNNLRSVPPVSLCPVAFKHVISQDLSKQVIMVVSGFNFVTCGLMNDEVFMAKCFCTVHGPNQGVNKSWSFTL